VKKVNIASGETWNYTFDNANRLTRAERHSSDGGPLTLLETMGYDAIGDRIQTSLDDDSSGPDPAVVTDYAYNRGNSWADLTQGGSLITRRLFQDALDSEFARIGAGGSVDWYLTDRLGSVRDLIDGTGAFKDHLDYSTFGQQIYESNPGYGDRYTYASREYDSAINLLYERAREYDASTGRWMSQDPAEFSAGDSNLYRYVHNDSPKLIDPTGLVEGEYSAALNKDGPGGIPDKTILEMLGRNRIPATAGWKFATTLAGPGRSGYQIVKATTIGVNFQGEFGKSHLGDELARTIYAVDKIDGFPLQTDISGPGFTNPKDRKGDKLFHAPSNQDYILYYRKVEKEFSASNTKVAEKQGATITEDRYKELRNGLAKARGEYSYEYLYINVRAAKKLKGKINTLDDILALIPADDKKLKDRISEILKDTNKVYGVDLTKISRISLLYCTF
jgi:RHS repeat-associated protein